ncbi:MAG: hypothetical protein ABIP97_09680 [Chthoniobacterales bacterium]
MKTIRLSLLVGVLVSVGTMSGCVSVRREADPAVTTSTTVHRSSSAPAATTTVERTTY